MKSKNAASLVASVLVIILITVPLLFMLNSVTKESQFVYVKAKQIFVTGDVFSLGCAGDDLGAACRLSNWIAGFISKPNVRYHLESSIEHMTSSFSESISDFVFSIPNIALGIFVTFFTLFYLFKDGKTVVERIKRIMPLSPRDQRRVFQKINETTYAIVYGSLLVAAIQGIVGGVGYFFFGISSPILWGIFTAIFALLPFIGTAFVWVPLSLLLIVQGFFMQGIGLLLYGTFIVSSMDNVLRPFIVGRKARIHPVLVLLGVLGGIAIFGFIGFVVGPLVLALFMTFLEIYENERVNGALKVK
jgi:predicted PurR-regulated permease PerM